MVICFVPGCKHKHGREKCQFIRFQKESLEKWEKLCRRKDKVVNRNGDRICSCHFEGGKYKGRMPTIFPWNVDKRFQFPDIQSKRKSSATAKLTFDDPGQTEDSVAPQATTDDDNASSQSVYADHSYSLACQQGCHVKREALEQSIGTLDSHIAALERKVKELELQTQRPEKKRAFSITEIRDSEEKMLLYTSVPYDVFIILGRFMERFPLNYYKGWRVSCMTIYDQLLMTLMKLRLNLRDLDLAQRFQVSYATVSNIFYTFVCALHELLFEGIMKEKIPSQAKCKGSLPKSFEEFVSARVAMDATEITQDIPCNLNDQAQSYSSYKSRHTLKAVTCVAPNAAIVYVSDLYPGSTSDVALVEHSQMLNDFRPGDLILADKGFTIQKILPAGVSLNIPPFLIGKSHFSKQEAEICFKIARARIHVERANERIKNFEILSHIPARYRSLSTKIFQLCCCLVNVQAPLLKEIAEKYEFETTEN